MISAKNFFATDSDSGNGCDSVEGGGGESGHLANELGSNQTPLNMY